MRKITIVDIAKEAGVSFKTVSRVMNNETGVGDDTRARVQALLDAYDFKPNAAARSLPGSRSFLIGLLFETMMSHYYSSQLQIGALRACRRRGYHLVVEETADIGKGRKALLTALTSSRLDGVILPFPLCDDRRLMGALEELRIPYVRITPSIDPGRSAQVGMDDYQAAYDMTRYLWDLGHRQIAFLGYHHHAASDWRHEGYLAFMKEQGQNPRGEWALTDIYLDDPSQVAETILTRAERPTAVFAATDYIAFGVMAAAGKLGLTIPGDLSLAGFDDSPGSESVWPPLTTIHQPIAAMASTAVDMLVDHIVNKGAPMPHEARVLDFHLVERASAAPRI